MRSSGSSPTRTTTQDDDAEDDEHPGDHDCLDDEQPLQVVVGGAQRDRDDRDRPVPRIGRGEDAVARARALLTVDGDEPAQRAVGRQRRLGRHGLVDVSKARPLTLPLGVALLDVGAGRMPKFGRRRVLAVVVAVVAVGTAAAASARRRWPARSRLELLVDAVVLERALLDVGDRAGEQQADGGQREHATSSRTRSEAIMSAAGAARSPRRARCGSAAGRGRRASCAGS